MWHVWGEHSGYWWRKRGEIGHLEDLDIDRRIILKLICKKCDDG
jgi:hypothetical protein